MVNDLITANQLATKFRMKRDTVKLMLKGVDPDGKLAGYDAWTETTFLRARGTYNQSTSKDSSTGLPEGMADDIDSAKLRIALADAETKELNNAERKNILVLRTKVEMLIRYHCNIMATKLRELIQGPGAEDRYNQVVEELSKDLQNYLIEEDIENIIPPEVVDEIQEDMLKQEKQDFEI